MTVGEGWSPRSGTSQSRYDVGSQATGSGESGVELY